MLNAPDGASDRLAVHRAAWLSSAPPVQQGGPDLPCLVCVPPAGGGNASFRGWQRRLAGQAAVRIVQLPGRGDQADDRPDGTLIGVAADLARAIAASVGGPVALFGHSLGAMLAYETAVALLRRGAPPAHLIVAAAPAPATTATRLRRELLGNDPVALIRRMGAIPPELLRIPGFAEMAEPVIRSDCALLAEYVPTGAVLGCPITVLAGHDDPMTDAAGLHDWQRYTTAVCHVAMFPGRHFFVRDQLDGVVDLVRARLLDEQHEQVGRDGQCDDRD